MECRWIFKAGYGEKLFEKIAAILLGPIGFLNMGTVTLVAGANIPPFLGIAKTKAGDQ